MNIKKNGFTLAELLGVIVVLALIALVALPAVDRSLKEGKETMYASQINTIKEAAKVWASDHVSELPSINNSTLVVTLPELIEGGYVEADIKDPMTGELFEETLYVKITYINNDYEYEVID